MNLIQMILNAKRADLDLLEISMKDRSNFTGPTLSVFKCPQCNKRRMQRPVGHKPTLERKTASAADGSDVEHYIDICGFCVAKLSKKLYEPSKKELKKVLKALHTPGADLGEESLEELL